MTGWWMNDGVRPCVRLLATSTALLTSASLHAQQVATPGTWKLSSTDSACSVSSVMSDGTQVGFAQDKGSSDVGLMVISPALANSGTSANVKVSPDVGGTSWSVSNTPLYAATAGKAFIAKMDAKYAFDYDAQFHKSGKVKVSVNGVTLGTYAMTGSSKALEQLHQCAGSSPHKMASGVAPVESAAKAKPGEADIAKFTSTMLDYMNEIVYADSRSWFMNKYVDGSMRDLTWDTDDDGHVFLYANYTFNNSTKGWVMFKMYGNQLECIQYWDKSICARPKTYGDPTNAEDAAKIMGLIFGGLPE